MIFEFLRLLANFEYFHGFFFLALDSSMGMGCGFGNRRSVILIPWGRTCIIRGYEDNDISSITAFKEDLMSYRTFETVRPYRRMPCDAEWKAKRLAGTLPDEKVNLSGVKEGGGGL